MCDGRSYVERTVTRAPASLLLLFSVACAHPYGEDLAPRVDDQTTTPTPAGATDSPVTPTTPTPPLGSCDGPCTTQLSAGNDFACALGDDQKVRCWGDNTLGQTGAASPAPTGEPNVVSGLGSVKKIVTGNAHACVLETSGDVKCWGDDSHGVITGVPSGTTARPTPTLIRGLPAAVLTLAAVSDSQCAILVTNDLWCWGNNEYGQLGVSGDQGTPPKVVPAPVKTLANVLQVGASEETLCARLGTGIVQCLGRNFSGNLGINTSDTDAHPTPATVKNVPGVVAQLGSGTGYHLVATLDNGRVVGWGSNARAAILNEDSVYSIPVPTLVDGVSDALEAVAGGYFSCARKKDGSVFCWGDASVGQAGVAPAVGAHVAPTQIPNLPAAQSITAGRSGFVCANAGGKVHCWGQNDKGQLGRGKTGDPDPKPTAISF